MNYSLEQVKNKKQVREFLALPKRLYRNDPNWVCPLDDDIEKRFDPARNELFKEGEAIRWILRNPEGTVIGRIAAFYNREQAAKNEQPTGGCGFFECIDDLRAASALFDASRDWLKERGMEAMDGPVNFGDRSDFWGVLVDGFTQPLYNNPYNFSYYKDLFEGYGFRNYFNQYSYVRQINTTGLNPLVWEKADRLYHTPGYRFEYAGSKKLVDYADDFMTVYNRGWAKFTGVKPIDREHTRHLLKNLGPIIDRKLLYFAYYEDEPIGFFLMVPDINQIIGKFNGRFGLIEKIRLMIDLKIRKKVDRVFGIIFGVVTEFQGKGIEAALIRRFELELEDVHYKTIQLAWVGDFNPLMMRMVENYVRATVYKTHTTYRYLFDREKEFTRAPKLGRVKKR